MIERKPVKGSANVASYGYDPARRTLHVGFKNSKDARQPERVYAYRGVPPERFAALEDAESKGQFIAYHIRGCYPHELLKSHPA